MNREYFQQVRQKCVVWLIKKLQRYGPKKVEVLGKTYEVSEGVFNPKYYYTSEFMARHIKVSADDAVLDIGTGSGIQAMTAAQAASQVLAIDINPEAVRAAERNVRANGLEKVVSVLEGDLFTPLRKEQKFSVILFTPPYLEGSPQTHFDHALYDGSKVLLRRFFKEAALHLKPGGYVQMLYSSIAGTDEALEIAREAGWHHSLLAREKTLTEEFVIYKLTPGGSGEIRATS